MFESLVKQAFTDMFEHLGFEVTFKSREGAQTQICAIIKQAENPYELGDSQIVDQVAEVTVKSSDITPKIGDYIITDSRKYKIYTEPLLDASTLVWKFYAVLVEEEYE